MNNQNQQKIHSQDTTSQSSDLNKNVDIAQMKPTHQGHSIEDQAQVDFQSENQQKVHHHSKPKTWNEDTEPLIVTKGEEIHGNLQTEEISNARKHNQDQNQANKSGGDHYYELLEENFTITDKQPIKTQKQNVDQINFEDQPRNDYNIEARTGQYQNIPVEESPGIGEAITEKTKVVYEAVKENLSAAKQNLEQYETVQKIEQNLSDAGHVITAKLEELSQVVSETFEKTKEELPRVYANIKEGAKEVGNNIANTIHDVQQSETIHKIEEKVSSLAQGAKEMIVTAGQNINEAVKSVSELIADAFAPPEDLQGRLGQEEDQTELFVGGKDADKQEESGQKTDLVEDYKDVIQELRAHHHPDIKPEDVKLAKTTHTHVPQDLKPTKNLATNEITQEYADVIHQLDEEHHHKIKRGEVKIANAPDMNEQGQTQNINVDQQNQKQDKNKTQSSEVESQNLVESYKDALQELEAHHHPKINIEDIKLASTADGQNNQQQFDQNQQQIGQNQGQQFDKDQQIDQGQQLNKDQQNQNLTGEYKDVIEELDKHSHPKINLDDVKLASANQTDISKS